MVKVEIPAQDIRNLLLDLEQQIEMVKRLEFFRGKLFFSIGDISGCLEIRPAQNAIVLSLPVSSLVIENSLAQGFWAFAPKVVLNFVRQHVAEGLGIPEKDLIVQKTQTAIEIHIPNSFIWEKLDLEFLPRKLQLAKVQCNENGLALEFNLSQRILR